MALATAGWRPIPILRSRRLPTPPRDARAASDPAWRMPPRVYTPFAPRRLAQPMAVSVRGTSIAGAHSPGQDLCRQNPVGNQVAAHRFGTNLRKTHADQFLSASVHIPTDFHQGSRSALYLSG